MKDTKKLTKRQIEHLNNHPRPVTRRDFLAAGLAGSAATFFAPSFFQLLARAGAPFVEKSNIPFLVFDCAGGASFPGNFLVGGRGGPRDLISSYDRIGWNPKVDQIDDRFGLPMAGGGISQMLEGMTAQMSAEAQAKFRMGSLCHFAFDDSGRNLLNAAGLVASSGLVGSEISRPLGTRSSPSGGRSRYVKPEPQYEAMTVQKVTDVTEAIGLSERYNPLGDEGRKKLTRLVARLSESQARRFFGSESSQHYNKLKEVYTKVEEKTSASSDMDARTNESASNVYGINNGTNVTDATAIQATVVLNTLNKTAGPGVISISGCDYHDGTQTTGDQKDGEIGVAIGRAVELAHRLQTPLFFQLITDGGTSGPAGTRIWRTDNGEKCMTVMGFYNPQATPKYINENRVQVGHYTNGQGADTTTTIGDNQALVGYAAFANYLKINGRIDEVPMLMPGVFSNGELDEVLLFDT